MRLSINLALLAYLALTGSRVGASETVIYDPPLEVCADPNNLPFSNEEGEGFENKLAELVAADFGTRVSYTWFAQRRGFLSETLQSGRCDIVMGTPTRDGLATTRRYYQSSYVFVSRADRNIGITSILSPQLRPLQIGVHLIGNDGANSPPAEALALQGIIRNVHGYTLYGDYRTDSPPSAIIEAVERGDVDIAAVWGPLAGYFAKSSPIPLRVVPITDTERFYPQMFRYSIAMGVREGDDELRTRLNGFIGSHQEEIHKLLADFGIPEVADEE